jgi:hypothetical protein
MSPPVTEKAADDGELEPKNGYRSPSLLERSRRVLVARSFTEKPKVSNSIETRLSRVNCLTEIRFFTMEGETRTFCRYKGRLEILTEPEARTGSLDPLPTMICDVYALLFL